MINLTIVFQMVGMMCASLYECASDLTELTLSGVPDANSGVLDAKTGNPDSVNNSQSWDDDSMSRLAALVVSRRAKLTYLNLENSGLKVECLLCEFIVLECVARDMCSCTRNKTT